MRLGVTGSIQTTYPVQAVINVLYRILLQIVSSEEDVRENFPVVGIRHDCEVFPDLLA